MSYGTISNEWLNKNNLETLWAAIVRDFVHAGANPVSGGDGGTTKGAIPYWGANSTPTGTGQPIQPSHLQIGSVGQFIGVSSNGIPEWTTPQILQAGGSSSTALTLYLKNASSVALTLQVADETQWGILTDGTQTLGGDKTFAGHIHGNKNIEASWGMSANGIADLAFGGGGGGGTVTRLVLCGTAYEPEGGVITVPASSLRTGLGLGMAAYKNIGVVTSGDMNLVTGDAVNSAINSALTAAMKIEGETTTDVITNPTANPVTIDGQSVSAYKGMVVFYSSKEFVWTGSSWKELGDEGSFALKTTTITGTGYLGGGGDLSVNRSLDLTDTAKGYITEGRNAYGYFTGGILDAEHMSAANIVSALGNTPVNRAIADKDGNNITTQYAVASTTAASIGELYVMTTDNYDSIQLIDGRLYDIEPYVYEMMQVARPDVDNSELNIIGSLNASRNIHASWGVSANGIADLAFGGGGGGGTITQIQIDGVPQEDVDGVVNLPAYPNIEGLASQTWVTAEITALNLGTASTHAHTDYVTGITWDSSTRKLKQSKGGGTATDIVQFGTAYSHNHAEYVTAIAASGDDLSITKGSENPVLLTVPYATLSTDTRTELLTGQEFIYRQTAGGALTYKPSSAVLKRILGNSVVWNQIVKFADFTQSSGATFSDITNNGVTITSTGTGDKGLTKSNAFTSGHKVFVRANCKASASGVVAAIYCGSWNSGTYASRTSTDTNWYNITALLTAAGALQLSFYLANSSSGQSLQFKDCVAIDLTLFFNGNIPTGLTAETFERDYGYLLSNPEYNAGQLINNSAEGLESVGFNIWDEEYDRGYYVYEGTDGTMISNSNYFCSKNKIPVFSGQNYYVKAPVILEFIEYDKNGNFIRIASYKPKDSIITISNDTYYINFNVQVGGTITTYNHDICINLSDSNRNGQYEPYRKVKTPLNLKEIKVKSHNIWDEEWENGLINSQTGVESDSTTNSRTKNYIPVKEGQTYYFKSPYNLYTMLYDKNKTFISQGTTLANATYQIPNGVHYVRFVTDYSSITIGDICINESSSFNGQYEPHGILTINGLKQAGSVRDERVGKKFIQRVGSVDLGNIGWVKATSSIPGYFLCEFFTTFNYKTTNKDECVCSKYEGGVWDGQDATDMKAKVVYLLNKPPYDFNGIYFIDASLDSYTDEQFRAAMSGVMLNYELATPIEYEIIDEAPYEYPIDVLGTERIVSDELVAPFVADIQYGAEQRNVAYDINNLHINALALKGRASVLEGYFTDGIANNAARLSNTSAIGSATKPVYFTANGVPSACSDYAGGTAVTLNGSSKAANTASFYAPTDAGSNGNILQSTGGTPSWVAQSTLVAGKATILEATRTLWGQNFNGSANVTGNMTNVGDITPSADKTKNIGSESLQFGYVYASRFLTGAGAGMRYCATTGKHAWYNSYTTDDTTKQMELTNSALTIYKDVQGMGGVSAMGIASMAINSVSGVAFAQKITMNGQNYEASNGVITLPNYTATYNPSNSGSTTEALSQKGAKTMYTALVNMLPSTSTVAGWGYKKGMVYSTSTASDSNIQVATGADPTYQYVTNTSQSTLVLVVTTSNAAANSYGVHRYVMIYNNRSSATLVQFADQGQGVVGPADNVSIPANSYMEFRIIHPASNAKCMVTWSTALKNIDTM